jgi:GLPGLI family protein
MVRVLIKDSLPELQWKMESETVLYGYNCFKATAIKPVNKSDLEIIDQKRG